MFSLTPWRGEQHDGGPLARLRGEFDSLFDRFFGSWPLAGGWQQGWGMDLEDTEREVIFRADAPGFEAEDFDVQLAGDTLTVRAERRAEAKEGEGTTVRRRQLHRAVTLPAGADPSKVTASYRNGVLEVRVGKTEEAQPRRIAVQGS